MLDRSLIICHSPDRRVQIRVSIGDWYASGGKWPAELLVQATFAGLVMLQTSRLGVRCGDHRLAPSGWELVRVTRQRRRRVWSPNVGDAAQITDACNGLVVRLREQGETARQVDLILRCYDTGVAVCARLPRQRGLAKIPVPEIEGLLQLPAGTSRWFEEDGGIWQPHALESLALPAERCCTFNYTHGRLACILPAVSRIFGHMGKPSARVAAERSASFHTSQSVKDAPIDARASSWQVMLLADRPVDLAAQRGLLLNLGLEVAPAPQPLAHDDALWNCLAPFVEPMGNWPPVGAGSATECGCQPGRCRVPVTPAHRLGNVIVRGDGAARWDATRYLRGEIGAYLAVARRLGQTWRVGGVTAGEGRVLTVRLEEILENPSDQTNRTYLLTIMRDPLPGEAADADGVVRETFAGVTRFDAPRLELPPGGGFALHLTPEG